MSRTPDNLRPAQDDPSSVESSYGSVGAWINMRRPPTGLYTKGFSTGAEVSIANQLRKQLEENRRSEALPDKDVEVSLSLAGNDIGKRGSDVSRGGVPTTAIDDRLSRYVPDMMGGRFSEDPDQQQAWSDLMNQDLLEAGDQQMMFDNLPRSGPASTIMALADGGGGRRGFIDRAIQLSFDDPELWTQLQFELVSHGFIEGNLSFGRAGDPATIAALQKLVDGKWQIGSDMSLQDYLKQAREGYMQQTFESMDEELAAIDQGMADELKGLRETINSIDLAVNLTDPAALREDIQRYAVSQLGRRLSDQDVQNIVGQVHERQREEFWENDPNVRRYNELMKVWEDATTNAEERRMEVISGTEASDLDEFLRAISKQESNDDPNVSNASGSGAYGLFQFMPDTWKEQTRLAGLNPNDRSAENQWKAARFMAANLFRQFGNWRDVAIAWYAGSDAVGYSQSALNRPQQWAGDAYPSINEYADQVIAKMEGWDPNEVTELESFIDLSNVHPNDRKFFYDQVANQAGAAGSFGAAAADIGSIIAGRIEGELGGDSDLADELNQRPESAYRENVTFDLQSYLLNSAKEAGGVDADAYSFALAAESFYDLLGER